MRKVFTYKSLGETLEFAEILGWVDPDLDGDGVWNGDAADATELAALDHIREAGYRIAEAG